MVNWKLYSGPGTVSFGNSAQTNTTASFSAPGLYTLMLSAIDGIHAVAYDAVHVNVTQGLNLTISSIGTNLSLTWTGGSPPYVVEQSDSMLAGAWTAIATNSTTNLVLPFAGGESFFRVQSQ